MQQTNNWNLEKLERQAILNQNYDDFVLNESGILQIDNISALDIGCSNGFKTNLLLDKYDNIIEIQGIDIDKNAIKEAKEKFKNNRKYKFELKTIDELDDNKKYDLIILSYVLQHLENPKDFLVKLKSFLSDRGVLIIKVPDDSFKVCYPDDDLLHKIFELYENSIMRKQQTTKYTDRYIGKKVYNYLKETNYSDIKLYYYINDTINKTKEERENLFKTTILFRTGEGKDNIDDETKNKMNSYLEKFKNDFLDDNFYYSMTILYYIVRK